LIKEAYSLEILSEDLMIMPTKREMLRGGKKSKEEKEREELLKKKQSIAKLD